MPRTTTIAAGVLAITAALTGCDDLRASLDPTATPAIGAQAAPPALRHGRVLLSVEGDVRRDLVFGVLTEPRTYAAGEGPLSLAWRTSTYDLFTLAGDVRLGRQPTSPALRLQLAADLRGRYLAFASDDGSCTVTVERAERRAVAGDLACARLTDADGRLTIAVSGTFEATVDAN